MNESFGEPKSIVVTGAAGFLGRHLVKRLAGDGHRVIAAVRSAPVNPVEGAAGQLVLDVTDPLAAGQIDRADVIIHFAARASATGAAADPVGLGLVNSIGTLIMLEAARRQGARFILASSQRVYAPGPVDLSEEMTPLPSEPYGVSKLVAELWTRQYQQVAGLQATILRIFTVYGPGQRILSGASGVAALFLQAAIAGRDLWVDGRQERDLVYVDDAIEHVFAAIDSPAAIGATLNVGTGRPTSLADLAKLAVHVTGSQSQIVTRDEGGGGTRVVADVSQARRILGLSATTELEAGLRRHAAWLRDQPAP